MPHQRRRSKEDLKVLRYQRLTNPYGDVAHFVLVEHGGTRHAFRVNLGGNASTGYKYLGSGSGADRALDNAIGNTLSNITSYDPDFSVETERIDSTGQKAIDLLTHPLFGVNWSKYESAEVDPEAQDLADFHKLLEKQVHEWKGSYSSFAIANHRYWPTFKAMLTKEVTKKFGSKVRLYRGVYGDYAGDILRGEPLKIRRLTAWTLDPEEAKKFAHHGGGGGGGGFRKDHWLVLRVEYPAENVVAAPVELPDYEPDPAVYHRFKWESEVVIEDTRTALPKSFYKIISKSRRKLSVEERVFLRYAGDLV